MHNRQFKNQLAILIMILGPLHAASAQGESCSEGNLSSSVYYVPDMKDFCRGTTPCASFKSAVQMQGSGKMGYNKILRYNGKTETMKDCDTAQGAAGVCLSPYISVAADPRYYTMGDIISVPFLKGKMMLMPDGTIFKHPGYFIVQDTGGAIKGPNRFDVFTGSFNMFAAKNSVGARAPASVDLADKQTCSKDRAFKVIRAQSSEYQVAGEAIVQATDPANAVVMSHSQTQIALLNSGLQ